MEKICWNVSTTFIEDHRLYNHGNGIPTRYGLYGLRRPSTTPHINSICGNIFKKANSYEFFT